MKEEEKKYYVYAYLDPRYSKGYKYEFKRGTYYTKYKPFYIGAALKVNYKRHLSGNKSNILVQKRIKKIRDNGKEPIIKVLRKYSLRKKSLELEIRLIKGIGRKDIKTGPLLNRTDGGLGSLNPNKKNRKNQSKVSKRIWKNQEFRIKMSERLKNNWDNITYRKNMIEISKKTWENPELKIRTANLTRERNLKNWKDPEYRKKMKKIGQKTWEENSESRKKLSEKAKERWKNIKWKKERSPRGERSGRSKLTEKEVLEMRKLSKTTQYSYLELIKLFKVSRSTVTRIINRHSWTHI